MNQRVLFIVPSLAMAMLFSTCTQQSDFPVLKGPYLGQEPPVDVPEVFAPGIVSTENNTEFSCTFSPDGSELYFTRRAPKGGNVIYYTKIEKGVWIKPIPVKFTGNYASHEPFITADNKYLYYGSSRSNPDSPNEELPYGIWRVERTSQGWSKPSYVGLGMYVTATHDGSIYLTDLRGSDVSEQGIAKTSLVNGCFSELIRQKGGMVNPAPDRHPGRHPFIAPDESYIIFDSYEKAQDWAICSSVIAKQMGTGEKRLDFMTI